FCCICKLNSAMTIVHGCDAVSSLLWYGFFMLVEKSYHNSAHA
ncbi:hypothetical protein HMPREF2141_01075, partial [Bacteroides uniformis]